MLSENLEMLKEHLDHYADSGMELTPDAVVAFSFVLQSAIEDARALELHCVPRSARVELPENAVRFPTERRAL